MRTGSCIYIAKLVSGKAICLASLEIKWLCHGILTLLSSVATWTAVADWHQCGMFRCMPILATTELNCDHPCSPAIWDAPDANEFAIALADDIKARHYQYSTSSASSTAASSSSSGASSSSSAQSSVHEFVDVLMADKWNRAQQCPRESYDVYDLHNAIVGTPHSASSPAPLL